MSRTDRRISLAVTLTNLSRLFAERLADVVTTARAAEDVGVDQIVLPDHLAIGPRTDRYPYGRFPMPPEEPWLEPLTTLAAIAGATRSMRLATGVLIAPLRPALLLAKTAATLDVLSGGRLELGVGVGWQPEEFAAAGVPFEGRTGRTLDTLRACKTLWRDAPASFRSESVRFEDILCLPRPVQKDGIPIWFGVAPSERNATHVAELGAGWLPIGVDLGEIRAGVARMRAAFTAAGRDPATLGVRAHLRPVRSEQGVDLERSLEALPALREAGVTTVACALGAFVREPDAVRPFLGQLGRAWARTA